MDAGEPGIAGVQVSNGREVISTDANGRYTIKAETGAFIFLTKPAAYDVPLNSHCFPQFYSRANVETAPLNLPLTKAAHDDARFEALVLSDPHATEESALIFFSEHVVSELVGSKAAFALVLGDMTTADAHYTRPSYDGYSEAIGRIGIPVYHVLGNHDMRQDAREGEDSLDVYHAVFGPDYYSFDYGRVHFVALDTMRFIPLPLGVSLDDFDTYRGWVDKRQIEWLANDLRTVPEDKLVVVCGHIPFMTQQGQGGAHSVNNREEVFQVLEGRPNIVAFAGHGHAIGHNFLDARCGWKAPAPLHQVICSSCTLVEHSNDPAAAVESSYNLDAAPAGYHVFSFTGAQYSERFKPAGYDPGWQMRISRPKHVVARDRLKESPVIVNIFDGSERSAVECRIDAGPWLPMTHSASGQQDPFFSDIAPHHKVYTQYVSGIVNTHIWTSSLPDELAAGEHCVSVRTTDMFGHQAQGLHLFRIE